MVSQTGNIRIEGFDEIMSRLTDFSTSVLQNHLETAVSRIYTYLNSELSDYPDIPNGSRYVRTFVLSTGWLSAEPVFSRSNSSLDFQSDEENLTPYSGYLQDRDNLKGLMSEKRKQRAVFKKVGLKAVVDNMDSHEFPSNWQGHTAQDILEKQETMNYMVSVLEEEFNAAIADLGWD